MSRRPRHLYHETLTYYDVLGVPMRASSAELKRAYLGRFSQTFPDRQLTDNDSCIFNPNYDEDAERLKLIRTAYAVLSDPMKRLQYDAKIRRMIRGAPPSSPAGLLSRGTLPPSLAELPAVSAADVDSRGRPSQPYLMTTALTAAAANQQRRNTPSTTATAAAAEPVVYTAYYKMQQGPGGTIIIQKHSNESSATVGTPTPAATTTTPTPSSATSTTPLPRRFQILEEQLNYNDGVYKTTIFSVASVPSASTD